MCVHHGAACENSMLRNCLTTIKTLRFSDGKWRACSAACARCQRGRCVCVCVRCMRSCGSANAHQGRNLHMACATMSANATTVSRKHVDHGMAARTLHMTLARRSDNAIRDARIDDLHFVQSVGAETRFFVRLFLWKTSFGRLFLSDFWSMDLVMEDFFLWIRDPRT